MRSRARIAGMGEASDKRPALRRNESMKITTGVVIFCLAVLTLFRLEAAPRLAAAAPVPHENGLAGGK